MNLHVRHDFTHRKLFKELRLVTIDIGLDVTFENNHWLSADQLTVYTVLLPGLREIEMIPLPPYILAASVARMAFA